ncbi:MAG: hypothetical protein WCG27_01395 [Pseudomonadota bacterium]
MRLFLHLFLPLLLILLPLEQSRSYTTFFVKEKPPSLSQENFQNYIRPQIKSIVQEFYQLLAKLSLLQGDLIEVKNKIFDLGLQWGEWRLKCKKITPECNDKMHTFYAMARNIDIMALQLQKKAFSLDIDVDNAKINTVILLSHSLDTISNYNYIILHYLEEVLITSNTNYFDQLSPTDLITPLLHEMLLASEDTITGQLEKNLRENFDYIWANFIKKIEEFIIVKNQKNYVIDRLDELNLSWNSFHTKIVSRDYKLPGYALIAAATMRDRWNSILKLILASKP